MKPLTFTVPAIVLLAALSTAHAAGAGGPAQDFPRWRGTPELTIYAPPPPQLPRGEPALVAPRQPC